MRPMILLVAVGLASCVRSSAQDDAGLVRELAGHAAGAPQTCVLASPSNTLRVIDSSTIAYGSGRTFYVNQLGAACPALAPLNTLIIDAQPGRYCRGDRVRALEPGALIPGPVCILGDWVPYRMP